MISFNLHIFLIASAASFSRSLNNPTTGSSNAPLPQAVPNQYIATFKPQSSRSGLDSLVNQFFNDVPTSREQGGPIHVYDHLIQGLAFKASANSLDMIRSLPYIAKVEPDYFVQASFESQENAPWGLARVSQTDKLSGTNYTYNYKSNAGQDVNVYVIDTGINIKHKDFEGRAVWGKTIPEGLNDEDENGHGTHCAGTVGGKTYGVAKSAKLIAVRVLNGEGSGTNSDVIAGIEWAVKDSRPGKGKVISMSLGGPLSTTVDDAVNSAVDKGAVVVVAAGNSNLEATLFSPARAEKMTKEPSFSNWGLKIDVFAPGKDILSAWKGSDDATNTISGTSMACPHVAGLAATFISQDIKPKDVKAKIKEVSSKGKISDLLILSPNRLGYNDYKS
ncbi:subtilisin-like protein [Conidiobolus coronatus NRRL 28638]|uniref:Subtilisin-like protein n=1 Tax=Conidiobolus coronatus (strain ATCC 28846 / CBS 209.66 / NRRL 28638) TaxID=796925 RepID=A0A137NYM7_CONC2|nr:subtilisin-like protein [Conidiobolus coronatus NRRL 28638]|eukprot:KXN67950.1 subtilisin-like protein [Conidiobolus coronatus NRRL 28638]